MAAAHQPGGGAGSAGEPGAETGAEKAALALAAGRAGRDVYKRQAYYCFCTPERLEAMRAEQKAAGAVVGHYDGCCRDLSPSEVQKLSLIHI